MSLSQRLLAGLMPTALSMITITYAQAAVPPDIEAGLQKIGMIVDPVCTARLYRPLMPKNDITSNVSQPYPGITVTRNQRFGPDPKDVVDIFVGDKGTASRTVLIYIPGGAGDKIEIQDKADNAFYDNIARWATEHGMVGVLMQRKASPTWDGGAKDVSSMLQWVETHIGAYHGNADRMFLWAHSAGNMPMGTYLGRPEFYGPKGVGVKGAVFMSAAAFDIAPVTVPPMSFGQAIGTAGQACSDKVGMASLMSAAGALPGVPPGGPGGPPLRAMAMAGPPPGAAPPDPATELARSSLPVLKQASFKMLIVNGELDPKGLLDSAQALHDAVCAAGPAHCPSKLIAKGHSHMSLVFSIDTADTTVSGPVLAFIRNTR